jgi:hypothetical protein
MKAPRGKNGTNRTEERLKANKELREAKQWKKK